MNDNEPYIYYVKCKGHPNLAIQACSREEYRKVLADFKKDTDLKITEVEILSVEDYKRKYR
jgi:hypothetical protein